MSVKTDCLLAKVVEQYLSKYGEEDETEEEYKNAFDEATKNLYALVTQEQKKVAFDFVFAAENYFWYINQ